MTRHMTSLKTIRGRKDTVNTVNTWLETKCTKYCMLTQTKSGQAAAKNTEEQTWLKDSFSFYEVTSEGRECLSLSCSIHH